MKNKKIGAIIQNEFERSIKNKWYVILNLLFLATIVVGLNFNNIKAVFKSSSTSDETDDLSYAVQIYIEDKDNVAYDKIKKEFKDETDVEIYKTEEIESLKNDSLDENTILLKVEKEEDDEGYITASIVTRTDAHEAYISKIESVLSSIKDTMVSDSKNLTEDEISQIKEDVEIEHTVLFETETQEENNTSIYQIISTYIIFFVLLLCLSNIANTISQEKTSNSIEYILTSITPKEYMVAKILSMCLIVILQFLFMLVYVLIAVFVSALFSMSYATLQTSTIDISSYISLKSLGYFAITLLFMCLTTFLQGIIQSVLSAKTANIQEAGNSTFVMVTINLILYALVTLTSTTSTVVKVIMDILSVIPIASMYLIPYMYIAGNISVLQIVISLVILVLSIPLAMILCEKPFKDAILDNGAKKEKKISGIEKIFKTREYQERMITRKESSKCGLAIGMAVILFVVLQLIGSMIISVFIQKISEHITFISQNNIYLILLCIVFALSLYLPYLILKPYIKKEEKVVILDEEEKKKASKQSIIKCIKYIIVSIPIMSVIQMICSFAVEKIGIGSDITDTLGLFNYTGKLSTILVFLEIAVLPAIFEELFIRKGVYGLLRQKGAIFATVVSSIIFATIHLNFSQFIFAFLIGILFAIVREKTGKLYPTMILHFLNNGLALIEVFFYSHMTFMQIFTYLKIGINAVGFCILIYMLYNKIMELKDKESIEKLKEEFDYRKIKLDIIENMYVFKDYTLFVTTLLCIVLFAVVEKIL